MWISWKHQRLDFQSPLAYEQKVEIFYEQTLGWQLHIADLIANGGTTFGQIDTSVPGYEVPSIRHSGFAVLQTLIRDREEWDRIFRPIQEIKDKEG